MILQNKRLITIASTVAILLLIPLVAMQFTNEVQWTLLDFVTAGFLLLSTGLLCELVLRKVKAVPYRVALCGGVLAVFCLIWLELAVGLFV